MSKCLRDRSARSFPLLVLILPSRRPVQSVKDETEGMGEDEEDQKRPR